MPSDYEAEIELVEAGIAGHIGTWDVFISGDVVKIVEDVQDDPRLIERTVDGLAEFVDDAETFRLGWAEFPDSDEVVYLYDRDDGNFGYAVNLTWAAGSEWGYAPF